MRHLIKILKNHYPLSEIKTGFTLIEVLLVIVIVSIIVSFTVPRFRGTLTTIQLDNTVQDIAQTMRFLRSRASLENCIYQLKIDIANRKYTAQKISGGDSGSYNKSRDIPSGVYIAVKANPVKFYADGSIDKTEIFLFKGDEDFNKDFEKAVNKEFDLGQIQDVAHTKYVYTILTKPLIGRVEIIPPDRQ